VIIKPNRDEKLVIQILIAASFGLIIGVWAMLERVNEAESERDLLILHVEELIEVNNGN
jgi:hypothetical protein|tara:strand:+ start:1229 stop:1405 length:177 start_codon:yes stop_codon:yes gene_type:complete